MNSKITPHLREAIDGLADRYGADVVLQAAIDLNLVGHGPIPGCGADRVLDLIRELTGIEVRSIRRGRISKATRIARCAAIRACKTLAGASTTEIAEAMGLNCHTTVVHVLSESGVSHSPEVFQIVRIARRKLMAWHRRRMAG